MSRNVRVPVPVTTLDQESTLVVVLELSARSWLVGLGQLIQGDRLPWRRARASCEDKPPPDPVHQI